MGSLRATDEVTARERIISEVICINEFGTMKDSQLREAVDDIIAAFEAVLLSDEVVRQAAIEIHAEGWNGGKEWADVHPVKQDNYKQQARAALQAALAAAKGTEDEQEDCGCTSIDYGWYGDDGGIVNDIQCSDEGCPRANKGTEGSA